MYERADAVRGLGVARFDRASAAIVAEAASTLSARERAVLADAIPVLERLRDRLRERDAE